MNERTWEQAKFDETLNEYLKVSSRNVVEALNTKAWYIARKANWFTSKVERRRIKGELGRMVTNRRTTASGRIVRSRSLELTASRDYEGVSLAKMILVARYRKSGAWPKGEAEWAARIRNLIASRERSTAFLKSGWLPAIRFLGYFVPNKSGAPAVDSDAKLYGEPKGSAMPALVGDSVPAASIINDAIARRDTKNSLAKFGAKALDLAFYDETQWMIVYIEEKLKKATDEANSKLK